MVRAGQETYRPAEQHENNATIATLEPISSIEAVEYAAVPTEEGSKEAREAFERGSVTVYGESVKAFEHKEIIEHDGEFYYQDRTQGGP